MILEHAFRRVRVPPAQQTPENVAMARENLYLLLLNLANRGLNLWCVQSDLIGLTSGKGVYEALGGTIDILNVVYCRPTRSSGTDTTTATSVTTEFASAPSIRRVGFKFADIQTAETVVLQVSDDNATWTDVETYTRTDWVIGNWYWFDIPVTSALFFRITSVSTIDCTEFYLASAVSDLPVIQWNRDTWATIPNKTQIGSPSTNYYLERLLTPRVTLWPVPNNAYDHLQLFVQRQIQDVGTLVQQIEAPQRWVENIIWQLAARIGFELPQVDPNLLPMVLQMADKMMIEVEHDESDGAPIMLQPGISVYTR